MLVIHENRGLTDHIRTIPTASRPTATPRSAIDLLSEEGGTASLPTEGDATAALGNAPAERMIADLRAGLDELQRRAPGSKLAVIGFCFGGGMTWQLLAAGEPRLRRRAVLRAVPRRRRRSRDHRMPPVLGIYGEHGQPGHRHEGRRRRGPHSAGLTHELRRLRRRGPCVLQRHRRPVQRRRGDPGVRGDDRLVRSAPRLSHRRPRRTSDADVLVPQLGLGGDELVHQRDALVVVEHDHLDAARPQHGPRRP